MSLDYFTADVDPSFTSGYSYDTSTWMPDDFFTNDDKFKSDIDWSDIYANPDVLKGYGDDSNSDLLGKGLKFLSEYDKGSGTDEKSQYFDAQKAAAGLPTDKSRGSWYQQITPSIGMYGGNMFGGGYTPQLATIQGGQSLLAGLNPGMQNLGFNDYAKMAAQGMGKQLMNKALYGINPVLGAVNQFYPGGATEAFKDVTKFAGGIGKTVSKGIGSVVKPVQDFLDGIFCDERLKVDIAPLESTEVNDELAQMAFFVKGLRECS